jgi:hypothetical protein
MKTFAKLLISGIVVVGLVSSRAEARGYLSTGMPEDNAMVANGQGISSPSFWDGLSGANPAGLIRNTDFKLQGTAATFDDSTNNMRESGAILGGNGTVGAGVEYSNYDAGPFPTGQHQINYGLALNLETLHTAFGVSGHTVSNNGGSTYDVGALIALTSQLHLGAVIPNFTNGLHVVAAGFTYAADPMVDFVVDAGYPGISIHTNLIQATAAYGFRFTGDSDDVLVTTKFTAGLGIKLAEMLLVEYEYRGLPEHRVGLTLRFN